MTQATRRSTYFDRDFEMTAVKILPGEFFATADATAITTVLGSCVSVCLYDRVAAIGGMNHFMLPELMQGGNPTCSAACNETCIGSCCARYGSCAMRQLMQQLELLGANRRRLEAKLFGAGRVMAGVTDIGEKNAAFALDYLDKQRIAVVSSDLGATCPRKVLFFPGTGRAFVKRIRETPAGS
jgi:chemotaxis protein CheD